MSTYPPVPPAAPAYPPPKKSGALKWILIGVGGFFVIVVVCMVGLGLFVVHKAKQAGLDPDLIKKNPSLAVAKMAVTANPNLEVVSTDDGKQEITIRDKQSGKVTTMSFEEAKKGKFVFKEDGKEALTITSSGANGTVEMKSADGTVKIGGNAKVPAWVPDYPGSEPVGSFSAQAKDGDSGNFTFRTKDSSAKVVKFYEDQLQSLGLKLTNNISGQSGVSTGGVLVAQDESNQHTVTVLIGQESSETTVNVTYATKK